MPQMAPISWLILFIIFSFSFILFSILNYYSYLPFSPKSINLKTIKLNSMNWKW
uniref:ATP synthase F0 subunit 8 n=1 Tax=Amiota dentata TaxID=518782 RepID=UPI0026E41BE3|nr:ATP synthase F0 subunit 8 [Amiota dentata]WJW73323.1 ATP synthase F0 subunit 8 [Amiota dentata]